MLADSRENAGITSSFMAPEGEGVKKIGEPKELGADNWLRSLRQILENPEKVAKNTVTIY